MFGEVPTFRCYFAGWIGSGDVYVAFHNILFETSNVMQNSSQALF